MRLKTDIKKKKILLNGGNILCNGCKMRTEELIKMVEHYLYEVRQLKGIMNVKIDQEKFNYGIRFNLFNIYCTVGKLFELYNEIAEKNELKTYTKLWYNPAMAIKISPSKLNVGC